MAKPLKIEGLLFPIEVREVTERYLQRVVGTSRPGERVMAAYIPDDNLIYLSKEMNSVDKLHTLLHELYHVFEDHAHKGNMDEEARADAFATLIIRLFNPKDIREILSNRP